ncbi:hypothetical protein ON010_g17658 [Phytophthora cinnamomi]|nr:hypothetical protein ON010_g17658 [Phytophthora cinnamomi]
MNPCLIRISGVSLGAVFWASTVDHVISLVVPLISPDSGCRSGSASRAPRGAAGRCAAASATRPGTPSLSRAWSTQRCRSRSATWPPARARTWPAPPAESALPKQHAPHRQLQRLSTSPLRRAS